MADQPNEQKDKQKTLSGQETKSEPDLNVAGQEYLEGWKRALADYDNLKKDLARQKEEMREAVIIATVSKFLPALDGLDRALKQAPRDSSVGHWLDGLRLVHGQFESAFSGLGVFSFGAVGEAFDPHWHEAIGEREGPVSETTQIIEVLERGWRTSNAIIKPAKVIINNFQNQT